MLPEPTRERETVTKIYGTTAQTIQRYVWALDIVRGSKNVLDAACGAGFGTKLLSMACDKVTGLDYSSDAVWLATEYFKEPNNEFYKFDLNVSTFNGDRYDAIVSIETLEHLSEPEHFLRQCYNSLSPDGVMLVTTPNEVNYPYECLVASGHKFHQRHYTFEELRDLVKGVGFNVLDAFMQFNPFVNGGEMSYIISQGTTGMVHLLVLGRNS